MSWRKPKNEESAQISLRTDWGARCDRLTANCMTCWRARSSEAWKRDRDVRTLRRLLEGISTRVLDYMLEKINGCLLAGEVFFYCEDAKDDCWVWRIPYL